MIRLIDICMYWAMLVLYSYINIIEYVKNPLPILSLSPIYTSVVSDTVIRSILYTSDPITNWNDHSITKVIERTESSGKGQLLLFFFSMRTITAGVMYTKRLKHLVRHRHIHIQLSHPKIYHQSINQIIYYTNSIEILIIIQRIKTNENFQMILFHFNYINMSKMTLSHIFLF